MGCAVLYRVCLKRYHIVHAVEESVFMAMLLKVLVGIPYVYDMDSSLAQQMIEKFRILKPLASVFNYAEGLAIRNATAVVPVCEALAILIERYRPAKVMILHDVPLSMESHVDEVSRREAPFDQIDQTRSIIMYVGNLEDYQGIDLLLRAFALVSRKHFHVDLVIIGGVKVDIQKYKQKAQALGIEGIVCFLGPQPLGQLSSFLSQADILVSPRVKGQNTPMKLYSYLQSGKPIVATNILTHTQVLDDTVAVLAEPVPEGFANQLLWLFEHKDIGHARGLAGKKMVEEKFSHETFRQKVNELYDWIAVEETAHAKNSPDSCVCQSSSSSKGSESSE